MIDILRFTLPAFAMAAVAFLVANRRVTARVRRDRWIKFATYLVIVHTVLAAAAFGTGPIVLLLSLVALLGFIETIRAAQHLDASSAATVVLVFMMAATGMIWFALHAPPSRVSFLYIVIAAFDGFSQAGGQLAGRTKLAPRISPGKTVEGFLIGAGAATLCAYLLRDVAHLRAVQAVAIGVAASTAGLAGDLGASWVKRRVEIKDFGTLLPGHGGILDRFDSFLAAAAVMSIVSRWF